MRRDVQRLGAGAFDVVVIGGGITGACAARDAAMRGLKVALVEKKDFSHATSSATSKLVHGGLRYLKNLEFGLVRESLAERRVWQAIAPHLVYPLPFVVPLQGGWRERLTLRIGLKLYDWLAYDRNRLDDPDQRMPGSRGVSRDELAQAAPAAVESGYPGALSYSDCQMYAPERLGLECLKDACARGAVIANYAEAVAVEPGRVVARCALTGEEVRISGRVALNAAGPWADGVMAMAQGGRASHRLMRAKGIHLIVRKLTSGAALAMFAKGGHFFVLPWRGHSILGTTDDAFAGRPDDVQVTPDDVAKMLALVNEGLPSLRLTPADVIHAYAGVRPLIDDAPEGAEAGSYKKSRKAEIIDHAAEGGPEGFVSALGGKWTTSRRVAADAVDLIERKLGRTPRRAGTSRVPLGGRSVGNFRGFVARAQGDHRRIAPEVIENLVRNYGAAYEDVIAAAAGDLELLRPLSERLPDCGAQIVHAARSEMAMALEDAVFRRTGIGTLGHPGDAALARCAWIMAEARGWTAAEQSRQVEAVLERFRWGASAAAPVPPP